MTKVNKMQSLTNDKKNTNINKVQIKPKKSFITSGVELVKIFSTINSVWNMGNLDLLIESKNELLDDVNITFNKDEYTEFSLIYNSLCDNFYFIESNVQNYYSLVYLPLTNKEFNTFINVHKDNINDFNKFALNYEYLEEGLLTSVLSQYESYEFLATVNGESRTPTSLDIKTFRDEFSQYKSSINLNPKFLNSTEFNDDYYKTLSDEDKFDLFVVFYTSMNYKNMEKILSYDNGSIYRILQEKHPSVYLFVDLLQKSNMSLYLSMGSLNLLTTLTVTENLLQQKDVILVFFKTIALYQNFTQIMLNNFKKIELNSLKYGDEFDKIVKNYGVSLYDNFNDMLTIDEIN